MPDPMYRHVPLATLYTGCRHGYRSRLALVSFLTTGYFIDCEHFIRGAKVQTDQNNEQLSVLPEETAETVGQQGFIGDMVDRRVIICY